MDGQEKYILSRDALIELLTSELPVLRAKMGMSQEELSKRVGISRQTYSTVESRKSKMTWVTFMALLAFFQNNEETKVLLERIGFFNSLAFKQSLKFK